MKKSVKITVSGKVQGVYYRDFVKKEAETLQVEGTIQNSPNGAVVIFASGTTDMLDNLIDMLYQGSRKAQIENVMVEPLLTHKDYRGVFRIIGMSR